METFDVRTRPPLSERGGELERLSPVNVRVHAHILVVDGAAQPYAQGKHVGVHLPFAVIFVGAEDASVESDGTLSVLSGCHIAKAYVVIVRAFDFYVKAIVCIEYAVSVCLFIIKCETGVSVIPDFLTQSFLYKDEIARLLTRFVQPCIDGVRH